MSDARDTSATGFSDMITVSVDAMGGDQGPAAVIDGCALSLAKNPQLHILLHGDEAVLAPLVARKPGLAKRLTLQHSPDTVKMDDKPAQVMRHGRGTSMWNALGAQRKGDAQATVSCGNTGALMAVSMLQLRKLPGVHRPAIACLWPSRGKTGFNTMLDVGADVRADEESLLQYAMMGAAYYRNAFNMPRPRVGLLNVGTEDHKGRAEIKEAALLIAQAAQIGQFEFVGFVEGSDIPSERVDVIVTDGFTGNVALKTGEGTARLISDLLRRELTATPWAKIAGLLALRPMRRAKKRTDPSRVNGGVFLGLNGTVVKSHGSADATGVSSAIKLAFTLARSGFQERMSDRLSAVMESVSGRQDTNTESAGGTE
ncbi:MAG: fatty acid/phospholipid synthesis protein PlsX [Roseibaca calidilacus]|uniref:Phosphate acyltransferase n=1 Tax=Roseibaca calidilacus TaxID=1666912 RepID=A0A0P7WWV3_9RHOB|nr:phosphate acyltransferase PlsX [Roseibaca calidilacus]KPP95758.1 MAG: fatty acid/phospholipid synthesis protein PlsX [Roseibaca calidilacus]CUX81756.1 phosphate:acyl-[acyl carrier protein] acyltransferase [Roseibaca calidilacus]